MPITGRNLARRFRRDLATHIAVFVEAVQTTVFPTFSGLNVKAKQVADQEFLRLSSEPVGSNSDGDASTLAEIAQEKGEVYYNTMHSLHCTSIALHTVGLFHLLEQKLCDCCRDASFGIDPPSDTKLDIVSKWYQQHFLLNLENLSQWKSINELRHLANTIKHGEGGSSKKLRALRPDLFEDPRLKDLMPDFPKLYTTSSIRLPIAGQDVFASEEIFSEYGTAVFEFINEISKHFESKADDLFFN